MGNIRKLSITMSMVLVLVSGTKTSAQNAMGTQADGRTYNSLPVAVPFLNIAPDAKFGAMGDAGVAGAVDASATYWNPSKLAFLEKRFQVALSYSPWLRKINPNSNLVYMSAGYSLNERNAIGSSLRYFNLGTADLFDSNQNATGSFEPYELALDFTFSRKFSDNFSMGLSTRYIHSALSSGLFIQGQRNESLNALAADISLFFQKNGQQFGKDAKFAFGVNIANIGPQLNYTNSTKQFFLPTNLKIGASNSWYIDNYSKLTILLDLNKLLVPTPPIRDQNGIILAGKDENRSVVSGIFGSFSDAPGGFQEELKEISFSSGFEYEYNELFALRLGYFYENPDKGNRKYFTLGTGLKYKKLAIDFSYLSADQQTSPLANTLRFSLGYPIGSLQKQ